MDGFLCVDKPPGMTSRDAVNVVQRLIKPVKVGHAGTLDPMATGVLVMALGKATKLISYVQQMTKFYTAEFELGKSSDTEDVTGVVVKCLVDKPPSGVEVAGVARLFLGSIMQRPPKYSALRVRGRRAYDLARAGKHVELQPRPIQIHALRVSHYEYPRLQLEVECGSGTYIRSLGRDIGMRLKCGAVMSTLRRTRIGSFSIRTSVTPEQIDSSEGVERHLLPMIVGVDLTKYQVTPCDREDLKFGRKILCPSDEMELAATDDTGNLLAILKRDETSSVVPVQIERRGSSRYRPAINLIA